MRYYAPIHISENIKETPEGYLVCIGVPIARTGAMLYDKSEIPFEPDSNGKISVSRSEKEVFRAETIASFEGKPITITHPTVDVTSDNWKDLAKGEIVNVRRGEKDEKGNDQLIADLLVKDKVAVNLVKNGLREVSCGYDADWIQEEVGHGWQEKIYGNHLALVDQGRAGSSYAINDSKQGAGRMKLSEKIRALIFSKGLDEAMKAVDEGAKAEGQMTEQVPATGEPAEAKDAMEGVMKTMDALQKSVDALCAKMGKGDADPAESSEEVQAGDEEVAPSLEDRLKVCEQGLAKLLEMGASAGDEDLEEGADDEEFEGDDEEFEAEDEKPKSLVGDAKHKAKGNDVMSRAEILAPGIKDGKDVKVRALKAAYATTEGARVIKAINSGKAPAYDSAAKVDTLFMAASELLKVTRGKDLSRTRTRAEDAGEPTSEIMTPEMINKKNEEFYNKKSSAH